MATVYVKCKPGRRHYYEGRVIPTDKFVPVDGNDPVMQRAIHHWEDLEVEGGAGEGPRPGDPIEDTPARTMRSGQPVRPRRLRNVSTRAARRSAARPRAPANPPPRRSDRSCQSTACDPARSEICFDPSLNAYPNKCRILIEGQMLDTGTAPDGELLKIPSLRDVDVLFGEGSVIAEGLKTAFLCCANNALEFYALPRKDASRRRCRQGGLHADLHRRRDHRRPRRSVHGRRSLEHLGPHRAWASRPTRSRRSWRTR